jgi:hypothetical protein
MQVRLTTDLRGPKGELREVLLKVQGRQGTGSVWYIIRPTEGYETDGSPIDHDDHIHYMHEDMRGSFLRREELDVRKYTFIPADHVIEVVEIKSNTEAKNLLSKEW